MMPPEELVGGLAILWSADADDFVVARSITQMLEDNIWPEGRDALEALTTPELRRQFVEQCWKAEEARIDQDPGAHNRKRSKTYYF